MEQRNNKQNSVIFEIENLLNKMSNQVNFLIRKDMLINQLDIDLLMENTRKLYDALCSFDNCRNFTPNISEESEDIKEVIENRDESDVVIVDEMVCKDDEDNNSDNDDDNDEDADMVWDFTKVEKAEDVEEVEETNETTEYEEDLEDTEDVEEEIHESEEEEEESQQPEEDSGIRVFTRAKDESYTLGDRLEQTEDNSLAARLQRKPVADLISAIGINDKFLFLNELFNGSMEKYNKSIRSLNSFSTLSGAKTYMSELQIEFQWNCESDAYKKLADLIERRFI